MDKAELQSTLRQLIKHKLVAKGNGHIVFTAKAYDLLGLVPTIGIDLYTTLVEKPAAKEAVRTIQEIYDVFVSRLTTMPKTFSLSNNAVISYAGMSVQGKSALKKATEKAFADFGLTLTDFGDAFNRYYTETKEGKKIETKLLNGEWYDIINVYAKAKAKPSISPEDKLKLWEKNESV